MKIADKPGVLDTPTTAREALLKLHREYILRAGGKISPETKLEISPLLSYAGEHLNAKAAGQEFDQPTVILD